MAEGSILPETDDQTERSVHGMSCFVIMPFGVKKDPYSDTTTDFDRVYHELIHPAAVSIGLECIRSDEVNQAGLIHREMIDHIINADIAVVDITNGNPNVMYELGVRHAAWRSGTIIIRRRDSQIPFNIAGMRALDYDPPGSEGDTAAEQLAKQRDLLRASMLNSLLIRNPDSLVHTIVPDLNVARRPKPLRVQEIHRFCAVKGREHKCIEIITGDIANIKTTDVWVNAENTRMELGRLHDSSVSAIIRYFGARHDARGHVVDDLITDLLKDELGRKYWAGVEPGTVVCTGSGSLERRNGVRKIVHVAALHGEPTQGYTPIRGHVRCMTGALAAVDELNADPKGPYRKAPLASVLFTLFGTRSDGTEPQDMAYDLVKAAAEHLRMQTASKIQRVAFLAYTDADLALCRTAIQRNGLKVLAHQD